MPVAFSNFSSSNPDRIVGGYLTGTYSLETLSEGTFLSAGVGLMSLYAKSSASGRETKTTPIAFFANAGWKSPLDENWHAGFSGGVQYVNESGKDNSLLKFGGVMPMIQFVLGRTF